MNEEVSPTPEYADAAEASAIALQRWDRHLVRCGDCTSVPFGGSICADGRRLLRAHDEALHQEIHAELRAAGRSLADCGECAEAEMEAER